MFVPEDERRNACDVLRETKWEQLAHKTAEMLKTAIPAEVYTAQDDTHSPKPTQLGATRQQGPRYSRGRGPIRGSRGRGFYQGSRPYNTPRNQEQSQRRANARYPTTYWPTNNQCLRCGRQGHRRAGCNFVPFCPFHNMEGHSIADCAGFKNAFPSFLREHVDNAPQDQNCPGSTDQL